jgi:hypothetical protein
VVDESFNFVVGELNNVDFREDTCLWVSMEEDDGMALIGVDDEGASDDHFGEFEEMGLVEEVFTKSVIEFGERD